MVQNNSGPLEARRRGRPRQYDPDRALASATRVFWKHGYSGASLDDLAAAAGMNRPSLYAAFGDKRHLYLTTLQRYRDQSRAATRRLLADDPPLPVFLKRYYDAALDIYLGGGDEARGCYAIAIAGAQAAVDPTVREFLCDSIRATDGFLTDLVRKSRDRGEIAPNAEPAALAQLATAVLHTLAVRSRAGSSREELTGLASAAIAIICGSARSQDQSAGLR